MPRVLIYALLIVVIYWIWKTYRAKNKRRKQHQQDEEIRIKKYGEKVQSKIKLEDAESVDFEEIKK